MQRKRLLSISEPAGGHTGRKRCPATASVFYASHRRCAVTVKLIYISVVNGTYVI